MYKNDLGWESKKIRTGSYFFLQDFCKIGIYKDGIAKFSDFACFNMCNEILIKNESLVY